MLKMRLENSCFLPFYHLFEKNKNHLIDFKGFLQKNFSNNPNFHHFFHHFSFLFEKLFQICEKNNMNISICYDNHLFLLIFYKVNKFNIL